MFSLLPALAQWGVAYSLLGLIALIDHWLGPELSTAIFYLIPIALMTANSTILNSMIISFVAALLWLVSEISAGQVYASYWVYLWNFTVRMAIFMLISKMIYSSVDQSKFYQALANKDDLTGILNRRGFLEKAQEELSRPIRT
jgi:hypothetical protein